MSNMGKKDRSEGLDRALDHMGRKTRDLRRQLRKAVVDHVSDSFLETNVPLLVLIEAAKSGNEKEVEEYSLVCTTINPQTIEFKINMLYCYCIRFLWSMQTSWWKWPI